MRAAREVLGLSQEGLAFECGLHRTYVSGVERGVRNPTVTVLEKLASALKIAPGRLLDEPEAGEGPRRGRDRKAAAS